MTRIIACATLLLLAASSVCSAEENQAPSVMNVRAAQQGDCSNVVEITYDLLDAEGDACYIYVKASLDGQTWDVPVAHTTGGVTVLDGDPRAPTLVTPGLGKHILWDLGQDADKLVSENVQLKVFAEDGSSVRVAEMCFVPAGSFKCSTSGAVYLDAFWIDKYEVTNALYCEFLNAGGNDDHLHSSNVEIVKIGPDGYYAPVAGRAEEPARWINWDDAMAYCEWRSHKEGLTAGSYSLPTEAQWEKAAYWDPIRGNLWGQPYQSNSIGCQYANIYDCQGRTTSVGKYANYSSYYGCFDMAGNVQEWCGDWYGETYPLGGANPSGPASGTNRVHRGGSWHSNIWDAQPIDRWSMNPVTVSKYQGFRCVRTIK